MPWVWAQTVGSVLSVTDKPEAEMDLANQQNFFQ